MLGNESGTADHVDDCKVQFRGGNQLRLKRVAFVLNFQSLRSWELPVPWSWTPSIVPNGHDQTFYLVINNYGKLGPAFAETDLGEADFKTTITDLMSGQYNDPVRVVAFNTSERYPNSINCSASMHHWGRGIHVAFGSIASVRRAPGHFRSAPINGHR